jgi:uncharacterized cupredoxin-like copper-binding protein
MLLVACSPSPALAGSTIDVTEKDFAILTSAPVTSAGDLTLVITNHGPATHELVVVRSDLPADQLQIGPDGLSADEDALTIVDEIGQVDYGTTEALHLSLSPGRYVLLCNLEGHYLGGMHTSLVVS